MINRNTQTTKTISHHNVGRDLLAELLELFKNNKMAMLAHKLEPEVDYIELLESSLSKNEEIILGLIRMQAHAE